MPETDNMKDVNKYFKLLVDKNLRLSRRDFIASIVLMGYITSQRDSMMAAKGSGADEMAYILSDEAVRWADALITSLDDKSTKTVDK